MKTASVIRDSVYRPIDRNTTAPADYGLYSYLVTKSPNENARLLLREIFTTTGSAGDAMISHENLNLIMIPAKNAVEAARAMENARELPDATAMAVMHKLYDFGHASFLIGIVCRPERGVAIMEACGSAPIGPILVSSNRPILEATAADQKMLVVNLENAPAAAIGEIVAAYRRQILHKDFDDRAEIEGWRLTVLSFILDAARLLPGIKKAYAGGN